MQGSPSESTLNLDPADGLRRKSSAGMPDPPVLLRSEPMKRGVVAAVVGALLLAGAVFAWNAVRQEREFRRLIAAGDAAITRDQTYEAIEAFSGALALKHDSMLAYLKRGDSYRRRGELSAALRDLREASSLDPTATRPLELLGDVNVAMGRYERATEVVSPISGARRSRAAHPVQARARLLPQRPGRRSRSSRFAAQWRSTIDLPKRITCWRCA